jgi:hypothetical protein
MGIKICIYLKEIKYSFEISIMKYSLKLVIFYSFKLSELQWLGKFIFIYHKYSLFWRKKILDYAIIRNKFRAAKFKIKNLILKIYFNKRSLIESLFIKEFFFPSFEYYILRKFLVLRFTRIYLWIQGNTI